MNFVEKLLWPFPLAKLLLFLKYARAEGKNLHFFSNLTYAGLVHIGGTQKTYD